jgi:hypothetical protein
VGADQGHGPGRKTGNVSEGEEAEPSAGYADQEQSADGSPTPALPPAATQRIHVRPQPAKTSQGNSHALHSATFLKMFACCIVMFDVLLIDWPACVSVCLLACVLGLNLLLFAYVRRVLAGPHRSQYLSGNVVTRRLGEAISTLQYRSQVPVASLECFTVLTKHIVH